MEARQLYAAVVQNVEQIIRGKRDAVEAIFLGLLCGGHVLLEDVPGVGKTRLAMALARSIQADFGRIQFTPDVLPSDVTGYSIFNVKTQEFVFRQGVIHNDFLLADEINRTSPKTQSCLLEAMEEGQVTIDGVSRRLSPLFTVLATQNPIEHTSTYPLPEAQLDRFLLKTTIGYPDRIDELGILLTQLSYDPLDLLVAVASKEDVLAARLEMRDVQLDRRLAAYIVSIVSETREHPGVAVGASVRGTLALGQIAKAAAYCAGRDYVIPDDIHLWMSAVLEHRLLLKRSAVQQKVTPKSVLSDIRKSLVVPK